MKSAFILALETGIYGGSICLFENGREISSWIGADGRMQSTEYLGAIAEVLDNVRIKPARLNKIVISEGPGSYTGLRIGFSIAKGFKAALGVKIEGAFLLDSLTASVRPITIAALPFSRNEIVWKLSMPEEAMDNELKDTKNTKNTKNKKNTKNTLNPVRLSDYGEFLEEIKQYRTRRILMPEKLYNTLAGESGFQIPQPEIIFCEENLAKYLGTTAKTSDEKYIKIKYLKTFGNK